MDPRTLQRTWNFSTTLDPRGTKDLEPRWTNLLRLRWWSKGGRPPFFTPRLGGVFHCSFFLGVGENSRQIGLGRRCHEASRHVVDADRNRVSSRRSATSGKLDDPDRHPTSLLYGNLTSTSAILKMDSNGCVWTSWCLLFILSLRSCSIEKHSSCRTSRIF